MDSGSSGIVELGRFMTGFMVVMGIGTFALLFHRLLRKNVVRDNKDIELEMMDVP